MTTYAIRVTSKATPGDTFQAIVGTPEWAEANLGGEWVEMPDAEAMFTKTHRGNSIADFIDVGDCWEWNASTDRYGYGQIVRSRKHHRAHRYVYEVLVGPIPDGHDLDHLCRNPKCVNPDHLEPVTRSENTLRGALPGMTRAKFQAQTHCKRGHEFTDANTYMTAEGCRSCRTCSRESMRRYREAKRNG